MKYRLVLLLLTLLALDTSGGIRTGTSRLGRAGALYRFGPPVENAIPDDPVTIFGADLAAWYDPSDAATVSQSGGLVSQLNDKSGNGKHLTASTTARPTYSATAIMQKPGLVFDGATDTMTVANIAVGTSAFSAFAMAEMTKRIGGSPNYGGVLCYVGNSTAGDYAAGSAQLIATESSTHNISAYKVTYGSTTYSLPIVGGAHSGLDGLVKHGPVRRMASVWGGTDHTVYLDNVACDAVALPGNNLTALGTLYLGGIDGNTNPWYGAIGELIIVKRAVTGPERIKVDDWLMRQWTRVLACDGDSLVSQGPYVISGISNGGYVYRAVPNFTTPTYLANYAIGGSNLNSDVTNFSLNVRAASYIDIRIPTNKYGRKYWFYGAITNNVGGPTNNAVDYTNAIATYLAARKSAGYDKVGWATVLSRTDGMANDTVRNAVNAILTTPGWKESKGIDFIVDLASGAHIGVDAAPTVNPTYFDDQVHLSSLGNIEAEAIFSAAINAVTP